MQNLLQLLTVASAVIVGILVVHYFQYRTAVAQAMAAARGSAPPERAQLQSEVTALRARVEVLEKIVTDKAYELRDRIADL